jgi:hypothetical protein
LRIAGQRYGAAEWTVRRRHKELDWRP